MKKLDSIVAEQALLLRANGYSEEYLNNGEAEGSYVEHLKLALEPVIDKDDLLFDCEPFDMQLLGVFDQKDRVLFTFSYEFDVFNSQITLKQIEARLNDVQLIIIIDKGSDVLASRELYEKVKSLSQVVNNFQEKEAAQYYDNLIEREKHLLATNGYHNTNVEVQFRNTIERGKKDSSIIQSFIIHGTSKTGDMFDKMQYRLHYEYHPLKREFRLKSVYAKVDGEARIFKGTDSYPIPPAIDIYRYLLEEINKKRAALILNNIPDSNFSKGRYIK
ncbi:hypothetical protein [Chitinophaga niabensis]|uniref:Uncharacterized protein n=1 Tax=Chitinophaga niabensis TaxID=536979 RepID=A0A1N6KB87_9BACT|nr:hypothetical protein [Chitinophaga niabensis]SIO53815.1 hypothetical protein SAMN04488055_5485 [Chitinophaga niabensis]